MILTLTSEISHHHNDVTNITVTQTDFSNSDFSRKDLRFIGSKVRVDPTYEPYDMGC